VGWAFRRQAARVGGASNLLRLLARRWQLCDFQNWSDAFSLDGPDEARPLPGSWCAGPFPSVSGL
jgi:hypothetical protein